MPRTPRTATAGVPPEDGRRAFLGGAAALAAGGALVRGGQAASSPTLLVSDPVFLEHRVEGHPERPERLTVILQALAGVPGLKRIAPQPASVEELELVHSRGHVERIRAMSESGGGAMDSDTYVTPRTFEAARHAVGGTPPGQILTAYQAAVRGAGREFRPDFVLVSAGFDAHKDDPIGGLGYEVDDYRRLMEVVAEVAPAGRIVSALEGGYNLDALGACVVAHLGPLLP